MRKGSSAQHGLGPPTFRLSHLPVPDTISKPLAAYLASRTYLKDHPLKTKAECGAKWVGVVWG